MALTDDILKKNIIANGDFIQQTIDSMFDGNPVDRPMDKADQINRAAKEISVMVYDLFVVRKKTADSATATTHEH